MSILRSIFGIFVILFLGYLLSYDRKNIKWRTIVAGFALQFVFAFIVMKTSGGAYILESVSNGFNKVIAQANEGIQFVFGGLYSPGTNIAFVFAFNVLPLIIFFGALISVLYHLGIMQLVIKYIGGGISKLLGTKDAESVSAAANIFLGQTEAPLVIKPYIANLSRSQLFAVLTCGVASVSGSTLAAYAALGVPMKYLIAGSFMAAPSGLVFAKLIMPETQSDEDEEKIEFTKSDSVNVIEAAAKGTIDGMNIALIIGAILISFIALVSLVNMILGGIGDLFGIKITLQIILGYIFAPITFAMGIPWNEAVYTGSLLGQKMVLNEFVAYVDFTKNLAGLSEKTIAIMSFALLGFANVASLGLQIGALGALAPNRRSEIAQVGMRAVLAGFLASLLNGVIAGVFF
ncbi:MULTISPECIES: NupC/NupG family nucleoside CNT transporter [Cetobacterium]|uniref:Nucleoside permease n=1 Tax=Candidatus Cetobacterium colombiensis TaxID=3073100 RepID=A0ABU4WEC0_9FUSO|nr:NupC/NupG family nucleoside CNT transporter [Candidatus Cetobacterium colombiensis]MDX8337059.1 NupC/NupG family nucleoside CNT transporter [Candidatus Cetobacterium colombiensis]